MKVLYYTSGITGSGRVVRGISIAAAFRRAGVMCDFTILHSSRFGFLADGHARHIEIPIEDDMAHTRENFETSVLYKRLLECDPDVLIVDLMWFPLYNFIRELRCTKIFLHTQIADRRFFTMESPDGTRVFTPAHFDLLLQAEPLPVDIGAKMINPIIIRNPDEILPSETALKKLGIENPQRKTCLFAYNGEPGEYEFIRNKYSYLEDNGYRMLYSTNYAGKGYFPIVDYFNAFDFIISGAGYNQFWEIVYFDKEAVFEPSPRVFEDQSWRIQHSQGYYFTENGADQLVKIINGL